MAKTFPPEWYAHQAARRKKGYVKTSGVSKALSSRERVGKGYRSLSSQDRKNKFLKTDINEVISRRGSWKSQHEKTKAERNSEYAMRIKIEDLYAKGKWGPTSEAAANWFSPKLAPKGVSRRKARTQEAEYKRRRKW